MIALGDTVTRRIYYGENSGWTMLPPAAGTVIFIHPKGYFYRVRFQLPGGTVTEFFSLLGRITNPPPGGMPEPAPQKPRARGQVAQSEPAGDPGHYLEYFQTPGQTSGKSKKKKRR